MEKKMVFFSVLVVLSLFGRIDVLDRSFDSFFGQIRSNEPVSSGQTLEYHVNIVNHAEDDLEDVSVRMYIYELGELIVAKGFDVDEGDAYGKFLFWDTTGVEPGDYLVRITSSNDDYRKIKHRYITIA